jgi:hypothetical protein
LPFAHVLVLFPYRQSYGLLGAHYQGRYQD